MVGAAPMSTTFSLNEAAAHLGVSYRTMRRYIKKGMPYSEVRGARGVEYVVTEEDLRSFTEQLSRRHAGQERSESHGVRSPRKTFGLRRNEMRTEDRTASQSAALETEFLSKKLVDSLTAENAFLREQLLAKDRQLDVKDSQLADYHDIVKRLTHQNEVLTMIAQGIEPMKLLRGGEEHVCQPATEGIAIEEPADQSVAPAEFSRAEVFSREQVVVQAKSMHREGKSTQEIREFIQAHGYDSFSDLLRAG